MEKISAFIKKAQGYTKFAVAVVGGVLIIVSTNLDLPDEVIKWSQIVIAIATAINRERVTNLGPIAFTSRILLRQSRRFWRGSSRPATATSCRCTRSPSGPSRRIAKSGYARVSATDM